MYYVLRLISSESDVLYLSKIKINCKTYELQMKCQMWVTNYFKLNLVVPNKMIVLSNIKHLDLKKCNV